MNKSVAVIGAGSWGTAIAHVLASKGCKVLLWGRDQTHIQTILKERRNSRFIPDLLLSDNIHATYDLEEAAKFSREICMVVPSQGFRKVFQQLIEFAPERSIIISAVKGIENSSLATMTQVMEEEIELSAKSLQTAVLSGPSFAKEVAQNLPTAVTVGSHDLENAKRLQKLFVTDCFRVYASIDVVGLEVSAAFKNIIAIATGICDGLGYGLNTRAALITRGLAEISRIGIKMGADPLTFSGLSGMGDLILTCTGDLSRNRHVGLELGKGRKLDEILEKMDMVAEGVKTTISGHKLAQKYSIEMPILEQVYKILYENKDCSTAVKDLLSRELKLE